MICDVYKKHLYLISINWSLQDVTRIKFLTDGVLLREMMDDPLLTKYRQVFIYFTWFVFSYYLILAVS